VDPSHPSPHADDRSLPAGRVLGGRYRLLRRLGAGGMGEVHLAYDPVLDRQVAIKLCLTAFGDAASPHFLRFRTEAQAAAAISNTYTLVVHDCGLDGGRPFLVTEYLAGGSWEDVISAQGPQPWRTATLAVWQAARGLAEVHRRGLTHRDLKPANLLRSADGNTTKIGDFGLVHSRAAIASLTSAGRVAGTPPYIAPELLKHVKDDPRADIYSLTATYYALLTGHAPFYKCHPDAVHYFHLEHPFPDPGEYGVKDVPAAVLAVVRRGSEKDPARRYASAEDFAQALDALLGQPRPAPAPPPLAPERSHEQARPNGQLCNPGQSLRAAGVRNRDVLSFWGDPITASAGLITQRRLRAEYDKVMQRYGQHPNVKIETASNPPMVYTVTFRLKGLVGRVNGQLQFANEHVLRITIPQGYPQTRMPMADMLTPTYHPNIDPFGMVCIGSGYYMAETIADVIAKVGNYLQYREFGLGHPFRGEIRDWILAEQQAGRAVGPFDNIGFDTEAE
jgi:serine/threonine protein kinase